MDIVYPVGVNADNDELRYSLRSVVRNAAHSRVWIVGYVPPWVSDEVGTIPWEQTEDRWENTSRMLQFACENDEVSDPFQYWNDDFFALTKHPRMDYDRGSLRVQLEANRKAATYRTAAYQTLEVLEGIGLDDPLSFELHIPLVVRKHVMLTAMEFLRAAGVTQALKRTVYGALAGEPTTTRYDVKVGVGAVPELTDWVSTTDAGFRVGPVGEMLREKFKRPSRYERKPS